MPYFKITSTTIPVKEKQVFLKDCSAFIAQLLGKPEKYVMVELVINPDMVFGAVQKPLVYAELKSIGLPLDSTAILSERIAGFIGDILDTDSDRIYVEFSDVERKMWGWNGTTF